VRSNDGLDVQKREKIGVHGMYRGSNRCCPAMLPIVSWIIILCCRNSNHYTKLGLHLLE